MSGPGKWLRKTFGKAPVLLSSVNPSLHVQVTKELLRSRGYFGNYVNYDVLTNDSTKRAKVKYTVNLGPLTTIDALTYHNFPEAEMKSFLKNVNRKYTAYLPGDPQTWEPIISQVRNLLDAY